MIIYFRFTVGEPIDSRHDRLHAERRVQFRLYGHSRLAVRAHLLQDLAVRGRHLRVRQCLHPYGHRH